eukprot:5637213-Karenia_brevis.AAC.1
MATSAWHRIDSKPLLTFFGMEELRKLNQLKCHLPQVGRMIGEAMDTEIDKLNEKMEMATSAWHHRSDVKKVEQIILEELDAGYEGCRPMNVFQQAVESLARQHKIH